MGRADYAEKPEAENRTGLRHAARPIHADAEAPVQPKPRQSEWPLSFAQEQLWFLEQLEPGSAVYNMPLVARLTGALNLVAFEQALKAVSARHESLRTRFVSMNGRPAQVIDSDSDLKLRVEEIAN